MFVSCLCLVLSLTFFVINRTSCKPFMFFKLPQIPYSVLCFCITIYNSWCDVFCAFVCLKRQTTKPVALTMIVSDLHSDEHSPRNNHVYGREFQSMLEGLDDEGCVEEPGHHAEKKRRLSVDQVKALEKNFEVENKLEPDRKVKLAQELGLQPRQVAVWFQNRRARWKTKQLERDYGVLKANYDSLKLNYDTLQQDNEALLKEVE